MAREHDTQSREAMRTVTLVHGRHLWRFRCPAGEERALVAAAARVALRAGSGLDVADAAILARRLDAWPADDAPGGAEGTEKTD